MVENDCLLPSFLFYFLYRANIDCVCVLCMAVAIGHRPEVRVCSSFRRQTFACQIESL